MSDVAELDDVAARALASIILEHTARMLDGTEDAVMDAVLGLSTDAAVVLDVAAAILTATSWIVGAGEVAPEAVFAAALAFQPDDAALDPGSTRPAAEGPAAGPAPASPPDRPGGPPAGTEGPIVGDGGQAADDQAAMVARAIAAATAGLAAEGAPDAPEI